MSTHPVHAKRIDPLAILENVGATVKLLDPVKVCVPVETRPRAVAEASVKLKVCTQADETILKSVPAVPIANVWVAPESPLSDVMPAPTRAAQVGAPPLMVRYWPFIPFTRPIVFPTRESPLLNVRAFSFPEKRV